MKTRPNIPLLFRLAVVVLPLVGGCTPRSTSSTSVPLITTASAEPLPVLAPVSVPEAPALVNTNAPTVSDASEAKTGAAPTPSAEAAPGAAPVVPNNVRVSQPLAEVLKLTQSGVDQGVLLTFITNSSAPFVIGAEEIVYLTDLGIPSEAITAMMQQDRTLKDYWAKQSPPAAAPTSTPVSVQIAPAPATIAAAPSYVNPPAGTTVVVPPAEISNNYFEENLSPYGTWIEVEGYGRCWQPTVVVSTPGWQPYGDRGRWIYSDAGWYWLSDYSWGAVAFHYGRWFSHPRFGWCWWPDRVWAPSWVSWRYSNDYCGWAPLPPTSCYRSGFGFGYRGSNVGIGFDFGLGIGAFTFVSWGNFCDSRPFSHRIPHSRVTQIYNNTTIVNNYVVGNNNTVINRGIDHNRVRDYTRTEIRTVNVRDGRGERGERLERGGSTVVVNRPILPPGNGQRLDSSDLGSPRAPRGRTYETTVSTPPTTTVTPRDNRNESRGDRPHSTSTVTPPPANNPTPAPQTPGRNDSRPRQEREPRVSTPTPTPVRTATPILSQPVIIQNPPATTPRPTTTTPTTPVVIGGRNGNRTGGRDYPVWSTQPPTPVPTPTPSIGTAPTPSTSRPQIPTAPTIPTPSPTINPNPTTLQPSTRDRLDRNDRNRSEGRAPAMIYNPPAPTISAPVQRPQPVITPAPSAPRIESRPAQVVTPPPAAPRSESRPDSNSGRGNR